jgi:signal transduction histidine kinase/CheY-like chemotaxis protein
MQQLAKTKVKDHEILRVFLPILPNLSADPESQCLSNRIFFENVGESFTELQTDGSTRHRAIETISMSLDGLTYRITLRKGMRFHCGAEITAEDAVVSILRVLRNKNSASQLHRFVANNRPGSFELPVQAVSRYRIEVHFERRVSDFLQRLSLPEFTLQHENRSCFSGPWKVSGSDEAGINLVPHNDHLDAQPTDYRMVRIEKIAQEGVGSLNFSDVPFAFAYEGTFCKSPSQEVLQDEWISNAAAGTSYYLKCEKPESLSQDIKKCLVSGARKFFSENSLWRRMPLLAALPDGHLAHIPFSLESGGDSFSKPQIVSLYRNNSSLPERVLDLFKRYMVTEHNLEIIVKDDALNVDIILEATTSTHPADIYSPLCQQVRHERLIKSSTYTDLEMKRKGPLVNYLQNLARDGVYLPLLYVPWIVRSNRPIKKTDDGKILNFSGVSQSEHRSRRRKVQEKSLLAIGNAVQMFVHDVKRPFSLVQGILSLLESTDDAARIREIVRKYVPDVKRTIKSVDGLIQDILEIGSDAEPASEDVSFRVLLSEVLSDIFIFERDAEIDFRFDLAHRNFLFVDSHKLNRVLQNLIVNAIVAMKRKGKIWFKSSDLGNGLVEICVGNSNSFIAKDKIHGLFDRFYTEGNKKGTGLGLAISHKIVTDHGGSIWCESDLQHGTEFYFTLPVSTLEDTNSAERLPKSSSEIVTHQRVAVDAAKTHTFASERRALSVLMLDDDRLYLEVVRELLTSEEQKKVGITFFTAFDYQAALDVFNSKAIDIVIADVDLGTRSSTGLDFVREIRKLNQQVRICVHSNGSPFELQRKVMEAGGDLFLPKPMTREHLISLVESVSRDLLKAQKSLHIAVIDDDALMIEMWESVGRYKIHSFFSPEEFTAKCDSDKTFFADLDCVVSDFSFPESALNGVDLLQEIRLRGFKGSMVLMTDRPSVSSATSDFEVLPKDIQKGLEFLSKIRK